MPKAQLSSAEKSRKEKVTQRRKATVKTVAWSDDQIRQRKKDKIVKERFKALGYVEKGSTGNYPCLCGQYPDDHPVWWLGGTKNQADHLYCLRCRKRVYQDDIADAITSWHEMKGPRAKLRKALID